MVKVEDTLSKGRGSTSVRLRVVGGFDRSKIKKCPRMTVFLSYPWASRLARTSQWLASPWSFAFDLLSFNVG
ncbi:hypothetical protein PISMIDRAFT_344084 [Pisolithus microcarpus 441]|uniref:Uncharacterized protein n=1 Tax=Pisolithus microcarpus 441 TaxID=765257 RepID=A0A0C9YLM1_9AGAM|nr:hypothetical protein PISMIDRAFT_344084 [Pisolithus microcarpus 441]